MYPKASSPLLMHVFDDYPVMPRKIMIVGQETHCWAGTMKDQLSLSRLLRAYKKFEYGNHYVKNGKPPRLLTSPFWNFSRSLFHALNNHHSGVTRRTTGFLWTNISKFDEDGTTPTWELQQQNEESFALLKQEIAITKPDIVLFLTGKKYDYWIDRVFSPADDEILKNGLLYKLTTADGSLPIAFKTEHPRTLCTQKKYSTVMTELLKAVDK